MINDYQKGGVVKTNVGPQVLWLTASPMRVSAWGMPRWDLCGKRISPLPGMTWHYPGMAQKSTDEARRPPGRGPFVNRRPP
jgi:hypothetical protein